MLLFKRVKDLRLYLDKSRQQGLRYGFVPTMGALHSGHLSLLKASLKATDFTVCSIFVNPTQFNQQEDYDKYPVTTEADIELLEATGCQVLFLPSVTAMYPNGLAADDRADLGLLETTLEGKFRPGHFQGVYRVMKRLLEITQPDELFMGQKDYQQCMVVDQLITQLHPNPPIAFHREPTIREHDGLARSSRNRRLSPEQRPRAAAIYAVLQQIAASKQKQPWTILQQDAWQSLIEAGLEPEYLELADAQHLQVNDQFDPEKQQVLLVAAWLDGVRLIDNLLPR